MAAVWASTAGAQSLGEIAQRERERRKDKGAAAKTYTEQDLETRRSADGARRSADPSPTPSPSASPTAEYDRLKDKALDARWRERFAAARQQLAEAEARAWTTRVETVFVHGIPVQQQVRVFEETEELRQARQAQGVLEEELRRAGLPPGWGRE
jgi:nucleotide-binding universal stress UspA family protein